VTKLITMLNRGRQEVSHRWPVFLPDGRHLLFMNRSARTDDRLALYALALDQPAATRLKQRVAVTPRVWRPRTLAARLAESA
jgi:hypothetical protein